MLQPEGTWEKVKESYHPAFKPGIAGILPGLHAAEEGFEGPVHSHRHVLENLGMALAPASEALPPPLDMAPLIREPEGLQPS
jgi:hypothetical protein